MDKDSVAKIEEEVDNQMSQSVRLDNLTSGAVLAQNTGWNLIGQGVPMLVAIFAIPLLIKGLGIDRFGVLTLAWVVVGYVSLFDLGMGRALTILVAEKLGTGQDQKIPGLIWTALLLMLIFGLVGTILLSLLSPWLVHDILKITDGLQHETLSSFYLLAAAIPIIVTTVGLRGVLEAHQHFRLTNLIRIPMGIFTFAGPLLVLLFSQGLFPVIAVLVVGRVVAWLVHIYMCFSLMPDLRYVTLQRSMVGPLISFGGWTTLNSIVGPLMLTMDRFFVGALLSSSAVAYYATPFEVVSKLWIITGALGGVLFPAFATSFAQDRSRTVLLFKRGVKYIFLALFPFTLILLTLAQEGLTFWLGAEFSNHSFRVMQLLVIGVFMLGLESMPHALMQGIGRPDIPAKLNVIELPFYLLAAWYMTGSYGIEGAALVWVLRAMVDTVGLFIMAERFLPNGASVIRRAIAIMAIGLFILMIGLLPMSLMMKGFFLFLTLLTFTVIAWFLSKQERALIRGRFQVAQIFGENT